jgi:hypothetical protein
MRCCAPVLMSLAAAALALAGAGCSEKDDGGMSSTLGPPAVVDATTLEGKLLMGYQGWFKCAGDMGSTWDTWHHWFGGVADAEHLSVDMWPDLSELDADELYDTQLTLPGGQTAKLFSSYNEKTVVRHFKWMKDHGLDGVFVQRFIGGLDIDYVMQFRTQVLEHCVAGAEAHGRAFAVMYDISGGGADWATVLNDDWAHLVDTLHITESPRYLKHGGRPVLAIWGMGFTDRPGTAEEAANLIDFLKGTAAAQYRVTLMGGVPTHWRTLSGDSKTDAAWADVYRSMDIISPWAVGRFGDEVGADTFKTNQIVPDAAEAATCNVEYMPVVWPGFSWYNLRDGASPLNQIPRGGGAFFWRQFYNAASAGCSMVYVAMFDEVDEGTAMFKLAPSVDTVPVEASFVTLDADGYDLPSDWYLRLAESATRVLHGETVLTQDMPLDRDAP